MSETNELICPGCGAGHNGLETFCGYCGVQLKDPEEVPATLENSGKTDQLEKRKRVKQALEIPDPEGWQEMSPYYQKLFLAYDANGGKSVSGDWNTAAFFFAPFWMISKNMLGQMIGYMLFLVPFAGIGYLIMSKTPLADQLAGWYFVLMLICGNIGNHTYYSMLKEEKFRRLGIITD
ncbi:MAG: DUF2628 domain-containing protein [Pseudomonadota bacterium]